LLSAPGRPDKPAHPCDEAERAQLSERTNDSGDADTCSGSDRRVGRIEPAVLSKHIEQNAAYDGCAEGEAPWPSVQKEQGLELCPLFSAKRDTWAGAEDAAGMPSVS